MVEIMLNILFDLEFEVFLCSSLLLFFSSPDIWFLFKLLWSLLLNDCIESIDFYDGLEDPTDEVTP